MIFQSVRPGSLVFSALCCFATAAPVAAQQASLAAPSFTVYKCSVNGKVSYTDQPCLGAQRINTEPTSGLNKWSGKEMTAPAIQNERNRVLMANAWRPLTGMNAQQLEAETRRINLSAADKADCRRLESDIVEHERAESSAAGDGKAAVQRNLFNERKLYRTLKC